MNAQMLACNDTRGEPLYEIALQDAGGPSLASNDARSTIEAAFIELYEQYWPRIQALVEQVVTQSTPERSSLISMLDYHMSTGGKRLRAIIPLLVAQAFGGRPSRLLPFAAACEIIHNATLVHDDLQDGDTTRRKQQTVWSKYGAAQAIDLGDAMLYYAMLALLSLDETLQVRVQIARRLAVETLTVIDGQEREFTLRERPPRVEGYVRMVEGKTSGLFVLPIVGAAEICGAGPKLVDALAEAARHLGVAFQIQDDLIDIYDDKGRGQTGNDIREGKRSLLVAHAAEHLDPLTAQTMFEILDRPREETTEGDVLFVVRLFERSGAVSFARAELERRRLRVVSNPLIANHPTLQVMLEGLTALILRPSSTTSPPSPEQRL